MVILIALILRFTLTARLVEMAKRNAEKGAVGRMEGHATNILSIVVAAVLAVRFLRTGGPGMLRMMNALQEMGHNENMPGH